MDIQDFRKVSSATHEAIRDFVKTQRNAGEATIYCNDLTTWSDETYVDFITAELNDDGTINELTRVVWVGLVNKSTASITDLVQVGGNTDNGNAVGDIVEAVPSHKWANDLVAGLNALATTLAAHTTSITDLTSGLATANTGITALEAEIAAMDTLIGSLTKTVVLSGTATIPVASWDTGSTPASASIAVDGVTPESTVWVTPDNASAADAHDLLPTPQAGADSITLFASTAPTADITVHYSYTAVVPLVPGGA